MSTAPAPSPASSGDAARRTIDVTVPGALGRAERNVTVHAHRWEHPAPRAVVVVAHGAGEHGMRYAPLARHLASAACDVVLVDGLGHGQTGLAGEGLGKLGPGGSHAARACLEGVLERVREWTPGVPLVLYGHSWGALLSQQVIARRPALVDGVVLSGTALAVPGFLNSGDLDGPWRPDVTGVQWLTRDADARAAFTNDPLCFDIGEQPIWSPLGALQLLHVPPHSVCGRLDDVPVLILAGSEDSVGFGRRGATALARAYRRWSALSDVRLRIFEGARHEVVNETNRDEVFESMTDWIRERFPEPNDARANHDGRSGT